ncbi:MAG: universal stress protein, partial [Xanthomonadales bacterium]
LEGKNYRELVRETNSGKYDLLVMGSLGLGAVPGSCIGTVCERVVRRSDIDTLVIKDPKRSITQGPIMVAVDGSTRSYGGLLIALSMAQSWQLPVHVVSAFDPYFHYVAFNRIAGILSEEAGKVFRFKEQEKLHEEIIDGGLAKIYQGHLDVAESIAQDYGIEIETRLLDGKPFEVIEKQVRKINPSLLVLGKVGIHADDELDIGGNAENLLRNVGCAVLLSQREYRPRVDIVAEATTSWTRQAEERLNNVPSFARGMARIGVLRYVQEMGHTVVTAKVVDAATQSLCPVRHDEFNAAERAAENTVCSQSSTAKTEAKLKLDWSLEAEPDSEQQTLDWTDEAERRLGRVPSGFIRDMTRQRIEAFARKHGATKVTAELMGEKYQEWGEGSRKQGMKMSWSEEAQAKIDRIPDFIRGMAIKEIERCATELGFKEITPEVISKASDTWAGSGKFHSDDKPSQ